MSKVITRHGYEITDKGIIHHNEKPSTIEEAEKVAGRKLDRRKNYCIFPPGPNGEESHVCELGSWVVACSGCVSGDEYSFEARGVGCFECGFTGKRRDTMWLPIDLKEDKPNKL